MTLDSFIQIEYPNSTVMTSTNIFMFNLEKSRFPALTLFALDPRPNLVVRSLTASVENPPGFPSFLKMGAQYYHLTTTGHVAGALHWRTA